MLLSDGFVGPPWVLSGLPRLQSGLLRVLHEPPRAQSSRLLRVLSDRFRVRASTVYSTVPYTLPQPCAASAELSWSHRR